MIDRKLYNWLQKQVNNLQVIEITGLRQVGKTTLMGLLKNQLSNTLHFPLQDLVTLRRYESEPERWALEVEAFINNSTEMAHVFVDEIQKVPALYQAIQGLYDQYKGRVKFWIWGSSARAQKRHKAETLAGRIRSKTLWPLAQDEVLTSSSSIVPHLEDFNLKHIHKTEPRAYIDLLNKFFFGSMLPEPFEEVNKEEARELLVNYHASYIENEIRRENLVQDIGIFEKFLRIAASTNGEIVNYSKIAKILAVNPNTIHNYYRILEDTFVVHEISAFSSSLKVQISKRPRKIFTDTALARSLAGYYHIPEPYTSEFGKTFETWVILEIIKQISYAGLPWKVHYLRTKTGKELDLVISRDESEAFAIEIKAKDKVDEKDLRHLKKFMDEESKLKRGFVVSLEPGIRKLDADRCIYNIPAWYL